MTITSNVTNDSLFDHWKSVSGNAVLADASASSTTFAMGVMNDELTAVFASSLSFDANGGSGSIASQFHLEDASVTLPDGAELTRDGYELIGWSETPAGSPTYELGGSCTMPSTSTTLYACWKPYEYTVSFDKNAEDATGTMTDQTMLYGTDELLEPDAFTRDGYTFRGWATNPDAPVTYSDGSDVLNLSDEEGGEVTLYAVWEFGSNSDSLNGDNLNGASDNGGTSEASAALPETGDSATPLILLVLAMVGAALAIVASLKRLRFSKRSR